VFQTKLQTLEPAGCLDRLDQIQCRGGCLHDAVVPVKQQTPILAGVPGNSCELAPHLVEHCGGLRRKPKKSALARGLRYFVCHCSNPNFSPAASGTASDFESMETGRRTQHSLMSAGCSPISPNATLYKRHYCSRGIIAGLAKRVKEFIVICGSRDLLSLTTNVVVAVSPAPTFYSMASYSGSVRNSG